MWGPWRRDREELSVGPRGKNPLKGQDTDLLVQRHTPCVGGMHELVGTDRIGCGPSISLISLWTFVVGPFRVGHGHVCPQGHREEVGVRWFLDDLGVAVDPCGPLWDSSLLQQASVRRAQQSSVGHWPPLQRLLRFVFEQ